MVKPGREVLGRATDRFDSPGRAWSGSGKHGSAGIACWRAHARSLADHLATDLPAFSA